MEAFEEAEKAIEYVKKFKRIPENISIAGLFELKKMMHNDRSFPYYIEFKLEKEKKRRIKLS
jgi:hypothetical protein